MKLNVRLLWLAVIAGGAALCRWYTFGPWWEHAGNDFARFGAEPILWTLAWVALLMIAIVASRRPGAASPAKGRWRFGLGTVLVVLAAAAVAMGHGKWFFHEPGPTYLTLPEILALPDYAGFELVREPDRPGPYERMGTTNGPLGEPVAGSFGAKGKFSRFSLPGVPGEEYRIVGLLPQDGAPTYIVLVRHTASASGAGRSPK